MLPNRKSSPAPRREGAVATIRVPDLGTSFVALVVDLRAGGVLLWTFQEIEPGTRVLVDLELHDGCVEVDGVVTESHVKNGLAIALEDLDDATHARLATATSALRVA
jgi:hypothetical protein